MRGELHRSPAASHRRVRGRAFVRIPEAAQTTEVSARELVLVGWQDVRES